MVHHLLLCKRMMDGWSLNVEPSKKKNYLKREADTVPPDHVY